MEAIAISNSLRQSPRKMRKSLNSIRNLDVSSALDHLHFSKEKASKLIECTIKSAVANLTVKNNNESFDLAELIIKEAYVNGGPVMKRFRAASMGRASRLRRPTSHLTVILKSEKKRV